MRRIGQIVRTRLMELERDKLMTSAWDRLCFRLDILLLVIFLLIELIILLVFSFMSM